MRTDLLATPELIAIGGPRAGRGRHGGALGRRHTSPYRRDSPQSHRADQRGDIQSRRIDIRNRESRQYRPTLERGHAQTDRRFADRPPQRRDVHCIQSQRQNIGHRQHGSYGPALGRGHSATNRLADADYPRRGDLGFGKCVDQPEDRAAADGYAENAGEAGSGPDCECQTDRGQGGAQPLGPLTVPARQAGYLLDEGTACAVRVLAGEPADSQLEDNASATARHISGKPQVGTMNSVRPDSANWTHSAVRDALRVNAHYLDVHVR